MHNYSEIKCKTYSNFNDWQYNNKLVMSMFSSFYFWFFAYKILTKLKNDGNIS
jgi:hypothetical protein